MRALLIALSVEDFFNEVFDVAQAITLTLIHMFDQLPGPISGTFWVAMLYLVLLNLFIVKVRRRRRRIYRPTYRPVVTIGDAPRLRPDPSQPKQLEQPDPVPDRIRRNKRDVIGWELVEPEWLEQYEPQELQRRIDEMNPYTSDIQRCQEQLATRELQAATSKRAQELRVRLNDTVRRLRRQFVDDRINQMAPYAEEVIELAEAALPAEPPKPDSKKRRRK